MTPTRPQAVPTKLLDNERVVTTRWDFAPGAETGWHRHGHDYVVLPVTDGALKLEEPGGTERVVPLVNGVPYYRGEGVVYWNPVKGTTVDTPFAKLLAKARFKPTTTNRNLRTLRKMLG